MRRESGFTLVELLVVIAVIGIIASIALPGLLSARATANETSAIGSLRTITNGQIMYSNSCGYGRYATDLTVLAVPPPSSATAFLPPDLTSGALVEKSGYEIQLAASMNAVAGPNDCNANATSTGYYASAQPMSFGTTGSRSFATLSPTMVIWEDFAAVPPPEPFAAPARPLH